MAVISKLWLATSGPKVSVRVVALEIVAVGGGAAGD